MANLTQDPKSGIFRLRFRFKGRYANRSLKTTDSKIAKSVAARVEDTIRLIEQGRLEIPPKVDPVTFILSDGKLTTYESSMPAVSIKRLFEIYQARLPSQAKEPTTIALETTHIKNFNRLLPANKIANALTAADLQRYIEKRLKEKRGKRFISAETVKRETDTLRSIWNWAKKEYVECECPIDGLTFGKADAKPPFMTWAEIDRRIARGGLTDVQEQDLWACLYLTTDEIRKFLKFAKQRDRHAFIHPMLTFIANTGVRRSEMIRAQIDDFDFESRSVLVREKKRSRSKATTFRRIDMNQTLIDVMQDWFENHPGGQFAFCMQPENGMVPVQLTRDQARDQFKRTFRKSKWEKVRGFHVLRHSFASNLASKGVDQRVIDLWMGHQTEAMRLRYRHLLPSTRQNAIELLSV